MEMARIIGTVIILLTCVVACREAKSEKPVSKQPLFYWTWYGKLFGDTMHIKELDRHTVRDSLLHCIYYESRGKGHAICMFTDEHYAAMDGGRLWYELDTFGMIFTQNTAWPGYSRLRCTNDSIDELIGIALEVIVNKNDEFANARRKRSESPVKPILFKEPEP